MEVLRRAFALSSLALVALPLAQADGGTRKSLSFKQPLPHAHFTTNPPRISAHVQHGVHPFKIASLFIEEHIISAGTMFYIRSDSYTDQNTGISHVYASQVAMNGLEVADGDVNVNVLDGRVLSYGSSFAESTSTPNHVGWSQETYCAELPAGADPFTCDVSLNRVHTAAALYPTSASNDHDPVAAAYFFALAAYPGVLPSNIHMDSVVASRKHCDDPVVHTDCWSVSSLPGVLAPVQARLVYVQTRARRHARAELNLAWRLEVTMQDNQYEAYVSAHDPSKIIASIDWVKDGPAPTEDGWLTGLQGKVFGQSVFGPEEGVQSSVRVAASSSEPGGTYRVWKWGVNDPASGNRTLEESPYDKVASPLGWHSVPAPQDPVNTHPGNQADAIVNFTTTVGNNVIAQSNWAGGRDWKANPRPDGGPSLIFDFPYGANPWDEGWRTREPRQYVNASVTQQFYLANMYHDLLYLYGFDEASGNFQQYNFRKGGREGDGVILDAQDSSGFNNANFMTPPDGQNGRCRMYIWNTASPFRDGGLDAGILIHELSHGLSTRLTGGPAKTGCLDSGEAGGMGEGWGDFIATTVRSTSTYSDYPIAAWAGYTKHGIRHFPYALSTSANPEMYDYLQRMDWREVHGIGEVWAEILWVVSNKLIEKHGFADSLFPASDPEFYRVRVRENGAKQLVPTKGNTLMLQLIVNGMKLQPCRPTFAQARDAIIAADQTLTGGENKCLLWAGFASRGLGTDAKKLGFATRPSINGFKVPPECQ